MDQTINSDYVVRPPSGAYSSGSSDYVVRAPDFTINDKNEGLFRMLPATVQGYTDTTKEIRVPFSKVEKAQGAGYHLHPDEVPGYAKDFKYRGQGPTWLEQIDQHIQNALAPVPPSSAPPKNVTEALDRREQAYRNTAKAAGRVVFAMPGYAQQVASAYMNSVRTGDPSQLLDVLDPAQIPQGLIQQYQEDRKKDPGLAVDNLIGTLAGIRLAGAVAELPVKGVRTLPELKRMAEERYLTPRVGPRNVNVAGVDVPVTVGEAEPQSYWGGKQIELKRRGVKAPQFSEVEAEAQAAVKEVIRRTAQQASSLIGPMQDEPAAAMKDAAETTFERARPMYAALDQSLIQVPGTFKAASKITQQAMARAEKLGLHIGEGPVDISRITPEADGTIQWGGTRISKATHPDRWAQLVEDGIINDAGRGTPLTAYTRVRSQLLKMQRMSTDAAQRYAIGKEVEILNKAMDTAFTGTPLADNWAEANRLWAKGYALRDVAEAIRLRTQGTPTAKQAPGLEKVPTRLQGASLVSRLNKLAENGVLERGFTSQEIANLRQSADIWDRIQRTPVGKSGRAGMPHSRGLAHALSGAKGPAIGAITGGVLGAMRGGLAGVVGGAATGAGLGLVVQGGIEGWLAQIMTRTEGVKVLRAVETARTPTQMQMAMKALVTAAAAVNAAQQPKTLAQLKSEAAKRKPAGSQGVVSQYDVVTGTSTPQ